MTLEQQVIITLQLVVTTILSMIIGMDRERHAKSAGLRTHMLTGFGSCLFTALSIHAFPEADTSRVAANIVTGIGFLGAGTIVTRNNEAHELTTAASIWATAAVGMAIGTQSWFLGLSGTVLIWVILVIIRRYEAYQFDHKEPRATDKQSG